MRSKAEKRTIKTPKIHIYTGDGKGKTTAALGLGLRAAGSGFRVVMLQFLKTTSCGELVALGHVPGFSVVRPHRGNQGFFWNMTEEEKRAFTHEVREGFAMAQELMQNRACDMLILDEIFGCLQNGQITEAELLTLMQNKTAELVLTGRNAPQSAVCAADYVSEIRAVKHPMETGLDAREGIEF